MRPVALSDGNGPAANVQADLLQFTKWRVAAVREYAAIRLGTLENTFYSSQRHAFGPGGGSNTWILGGLVYRGAEKLTLEVV